MARRKKLSRIQIHKKICEKVGITTQSHIGYLSRSEMLDVLLFLERMEKAEISPKRKTEGLKPNAETNGH